MAQEAPCEQPGCTSVVPQNEAYRCGVRPGGDEYGCGRHFCDCHLHPAPEGEWLERCSDCRDAAADPLLHSPDAMRVSFGLMSDHH